MTDAERFELTTPGTDDMVVREVGGGKEEKQASKKPTRGEVRVIRGWADALRAGRVKEAADFFAVPALVLDGTNPQRPLLGQGRGARVQPRPAVRRAAGGRRARRGQVRASRPSG